jgi:hypothetical protein
MLMHERLPSNLSCSFQPEFRVPVTRTGDSGPRAPERGSGPERDERDNVIDAYARKIAYQCRIGEFETPYQKKIAFFDSHFIRLLVEEDPKT